MKQVLKIKKIVSIAVIALLIVTGSTVLRAADPVFKFKEIPAKGEGGLVKGKIEWKEFAGNTDKYAIICLLHAPGQYARFYTKPTWDDYLIKIQKNGDFQFSLTTDDNGNDKNLDMVVFFMVEKDLFKNIKGKDIKKLEDISEYLVSETVYRSKWKP